VLIVSYNHYKTLKVDTKILAFKITEDLLEDREATLSTKSFMTKCMLIITKLFENTLSVVT